MYTRKLLWRRMCLLLLLCSVLITVQGQTDFDAIMMKKNQWCNGINYMYGTWNKYWEGTLKRDNQNIGTVTTQSLMFMSNYGISDRLNVMIGVPYVWTHATAGTLHGLKGFQDFSLYLKWKALAYKIGKSKFGLFAVGGFSTPMTNYELDLLPLSIGLGSTNLSGRLTADYQLGIFFATFTGSYMWRSNVKLDRTAYYTTQIHYTNEVQMPNTTDFALYSGIRKKYIEANMYIEKMTTLGGFDIRRNDMPFVSNRMNSFNIGAMTKYTLPFYTHVELTGGLGYVLDGRNVGQSFMFNVGAYYIFKL